MRNKQVTPFFAAVLLGVFGCVFAPFAGGGFLGDNFGILHLVGALRFAKKKLLLCLNHEIRFVSGILVVINLKLVSGRLEPFQHVAVIFKNHRKAAFGVHVKFLNLVKAFAETAEHIAFDVRWVGNRHAEWFDVVRGVGSVGIFFQSGKTFAHRC